MACTATESRQGRDPVARLGCASLPTTTPLGYLRHSTQSPTEMLSLMTESLELHPLIKSLMLGCNLVAAYAALQQPTADPSASE